MSGSQRSLLSDLIDRRVPQVLAGYLGVTWTLFELMKWLTDQYLISPYLGQVVLFGLLLFLPSVVLVTYRHGRPGPDQWTRFERIGIAGNGVLAAVVLLAVFGGAELGLMVRTAQGTAGGGIPADSGDTVTRTAGEASERQPIPKKEFRKRVALFHFGTVPGARADTALRRAVPAALRADLEQDLFVSLFPPERFDDELRERGYESGLGVPLGLKQEVSQRANAQYILSGQIGHTGDGGVRLTTQVRETETGDLVAERAFEGEEVFALVDQASTQLKEDLGLPAAYLESTTDLPVTQVFTPSLTAARYYAQGRHFDTFENAPERALEAYRRAVNIDSTFATGYIGVGRALWQLNNREEAAQAFRNAQRHNYRLSETRKFWLKVLRLFRVKKQSEAALRVCERWTSLYPYDLNAWRLKGALHGELLQHEAAAESYRRMVELAPATKNVSELIQSLIQIGRHEEALRHAESFVKAYPRDPRGPVLEGAIHWMQGRLNDAARAFRHAMSLDSSEGQDELLALHRARGEFGEALSIVRKQIRGENEAGGWFELWYHRWLRGKIGQSKTALDSLRATIPARTDTPNHGLLIRECEYYEGLDRDRVQRAFDDLKELKETMDGPSPPRKVHVELGLTHCGIATDRFAEARRHLQRADSLAQENTTPSRRSSFRIDYLKGRLQEEQGDFREAAASYEQFIEEWSGSLRSLTWTHPLPRLRLARSYQELGQERKADKTYRSALKLRPAYPRLNYHYARFLAQQGRTEAARKHLRRALEAWAPADSGFPLKRRTESLAESLGMTVT